MKSTARRVGCLSLLTGLLAAIFSPAYAQIIEMREYHGKQIGCARSGLVGWYTNCGTDDFYSQIFVGRVKSVKPTKVGQWDEFLLVLQPEEVFRGEVPPNFAVTTSQGECLPELRPGDRWLFYIQTEKGRGPLLSYGSESSPIDQAQDAVERLHRLAGLTDAGMIMGRLNWGWYGDERHEEDLANKEIVAASENTGRRYRAITDSEGRFEFEPLPVGKYQMTLANKSGIWTRDDGEITVKAHECEDYLIKLAPDGVIAGRITAADGRPLADMQIGVRDEVTRSWFSVRTDKRGRFEFRGLGPGTYLVGVGLEGTGQSSGAGSPVYYPGVRSRKQATPVELGKAEHRDGINIVIPADLK